MKFQIDKLHPEHQLVKAAQAMVTAHKDHEMAFSAIDEVREQFPALDIDTLIVLWVGINAKDQDRKLERGIRRKVPASERINFKFTKMVFRGM